MVKKVRSVVYGFVDESGTSGAVNGDDTYLIATVAIFDSEEKVAEVDEAFSALRDKLHLKKDYEFHASRNNNRVRKEVYETLSGLDFKFMTFAIEKDRLKRRGSYANIAKMMVEALQKEVGTKMEVAIDRNPVLYRELNRAKKQLKYKNIYFGEDDSEKNNKIQVADYLVNVHSKIIKGDKREQGNYNLVRKKLAKAVIDKIQKHPLRGA